MDVLTTLLVVFLAMSVCCSEKSNELTKLVYAFFINAQGNAYAAKKRQPTSGLMMKPQISSVLVASLIVTIPTVAAASSPIEAVVLHPGYSMGFGGAITVTYDPRVLYADGSYTTDAEGALGASPRIDGRWKRDGGGYVLRPTKGGSKPERIEPKMKARSAPRGTTLEGEYRNLSGAGAIGMDVPLVAAARALHFAKDGTLSIMTSASASTGDTVATGHRGAAARYTLNGWTITITGGDGRPDTRLFYFFPDGNDVIGVGDSTLSRRR